MLQRLDIRRSPTRQLVVTERAAGTPSVTDVRNTTRALTRHHIDTLDLHVDLRLRDTTQGAVTNPQTPAGFCA